MKKSNIFQSDTEVKCACCGKNLLNNVEGSMVIIQTNINNQIEKVIPCCKGKCDEDIVKSISVNLNESWIEFSDFLNPYFHLQHSINIMNNMAKGNVFININAFETYRDIIINTSPYVTRDLEDKEIQEVNIRSMLSF